VSSDASRFYALAKARAFSFTEGRTSLARQRPTAVGSFGIMIFRSRTPSDVSPSYRLPRRLAGTGQGTNPRPVLWACANAVLKRSKEPMWKWYA